MLENVFLLAALELNIPQEYVKKVYLAYWRALKDIIKDIPLREKFTKEDFAGLRTCFNLPSLGKLYCTYDRYDGINKKYKHIEQLLDAKSKKY